MNLNKSLPIFFNYKEEDTDNGYESIQDFFLSWTLRCAPEEFKTANPKVQQYARKIIYILIYGENYEDAFLLKKEIPSNDVFSIVKVTTSRQKQGVDLIAFVTVNENNVEKKYLLNIENKWYSGLSFNQLMGYNKFVNEQFGNDFSIVNLFITSDECRNNYQEEKENCRANNYKFLTVDDLFHIAGMREDNPTGSELFDTYWLT